MKRGFRVCAVLMALLVSLPAASHALKGDLNDDTAVTIADAILALKIVAGQTDLDLSEDDDVDLDGRGTLGLEEAIFALRKAALGSEGGQARAVLGPLSGATVRVLSLNDLDTALYTTTTDSQGFFDTVSPDGVNPAEYVLVAVSGGMDTDADDDGVPDATQTANNGTIHALMTGYQFALGGFQVTALSDIVWRYTENLVGDVDASGLAIRLNDLAKTFFISDLNGDGSIDGEDILAFLPTEAAHRNALNFDYQTLFEENADGHSIIGAYHDNLTDILPALLEDKFWSRLTLFPSKDVRYDKVRIQVAPFGRGRVTSDVGGIDIDSERSDASQDVSQTILDRDGDGKMVLTATPTSETEILSWRGCDEVSPDLTRCEVGLREDHLVTVAFGYKETILHENVTLVDLSDAVVSVGTDPAALDVSAGTGDADMAAKLRAIQAGDIVVGKAFLRRVTSVQQISDSNVILATEDASLDEVIAQGTGYFSKQMTYGDLAGRATTRRRSVRSATAFNGPEGVRLLPSDDRDTVFKIEIGNPRRRESLDKEGTVSWTDPVTGITAEATGRVEVGVQLDTGVSFGLFPLGLEQFKFIPEISAAESLAISISGEIETPEDFQKEIGKLNFSPLTFSIGPVPIWVEPEVTLVLGFTAKAGGEVSARLELKQTFRSGLIYNRDKGLEEVYEFTPSYELSPPMAQFQAEARPFLVTTPVLYIYSITGPSVSIDTYLKFIGDGEARTFSNEPCAAGLNFSAYGGMTADFVWDLGRAEILGDWTEGIEFTKNLYGGEVLLKEWNVEGFCETRPPFMEVSGLDLSETVSENSGELVSKTFVVKNGGDETMDWHVVFIEDPAISVTPTAGSLAAGQTRVVTVSVDTSQLKRGEYFNRLSFINEYDEGISGMPDGSTSRTVRVRVVRQLASPVLAQPQMARDGSGEVIPSRVKLSWSYPDADSLADVDGFSVWQTSNPDVADAWRKVATNIQEYEYEVANLLPNTMYYFGVNAYGADLEPGLSNQAPITTPAHSGPVILPRFTNSLGMTFVRIPAGTFMMGSPEDEPGRNSGEVQHQVVLTQDFFIMTTEVTQSQWETVMGSNPSYFTSCGGNCPVERVTWYDVQDFISALNAIDSKTYRLPTESEWEYAARAGTTKAFPNGDISETACGYDPNLDAIGWYCGNADNRTRRVAQKQLNAWKLYDTAGNVWEWCQDWYGSYPDTIAVNPAGPETGEYRICRGGAGYADAKQSRSAARCIAEPDGMSNGGGFRLAITVD